MPTTRTKGTARGARKTTRRSFGKLRTLPSGRIQGSYIGPDLARHVAPMTFTSTLDAEGWLVDERRLMERGDWTPPAQREADKGNAKAAPALTVADYFPRWIAERPRPLKVKTVDGYQELYEGMLADTFGRMPVRAVTEASVNAWHRKMATSRGRTRVARAYALLHAMMGTAVKDGLTPTNPCQIAGAANVKRVREPKPATQAQLETMHTAFAEQGRPEYGALVMVTAWGALRYGEAVELRRKDVDLDAGTVRVERAATLVGSTWTVDEPKYESIRTVVLPPHVVPLLARHLTTHVADDPEALLWHAARTPDRQLSPDTFDPYFRKAKLAAGRPDLTFHALRHTGATLAAHAGATLRELMDRLGHATPAAALRYQHAVAGRQNAIAAKMSELAADV